MKKIVLTGGPCAGKTTVLESIQAHFGNQVSFVPEVATLLLSGGWPMPGHDIVWTPAWLDAFQRAIAATQVELETITEITARARGKKLLVTDRGLLDGAAYYPTNQAFLEVTGLDQATTLARYTAVIHLESVAVANPAYYSQSNNPYRYETLDEAIPLEEATRRAWRDHPQHTILEGDDLTNKTTSTLQAIQAIMSSAS